MYSRDKIVPYQLESIRLLSRIMFRYKSAGGFIWRYSVEEVSPVKKTKSIEQYDLDGNLIKVWDSINSIENGTDYKRKTIYACANGQNSTAYGYVWKYCR